MPFYYRIKIKESFIKTYYLTADDSADAQVTALKLAETDTGFTGTAISLKDYQIVGTEIARDINQTEKMSAEINNETIKLLTI